MKRFLIFTLCTVLLFAFSGGVSSAAAETEDFSVEWIPGGAGYRCTATWYSRGEQYEMCITGLHRKLQDESLRELAGEFETGKTAVLTDEGLTDAEKQSTYIPKCYGGCEDWVIVDDFREMEMWGDSAQCWAASSADMLETAGWGKLAVNPETGKPFSGEDELFSYFRKCFVDDGLYAESGIRWFFYGKLTDEEEIVVLREGTEGTAFFPDADASALISVLSMSDGADMTGAAASMLEEIKTGSAVGLSVGINQMLYPSKDGTAEDIRFSHGKYVMEKEYPEGEDGAYTEDELESFSFTLDASGKVVLLEADGDGYRSVDPPHTVFPAFCVRTGHLFLDETGEYLVSAPSGSAVLSATKRVYFDEDQVDLEKGQTEPYAGLGNGDHALTAMGYVKNLSADEIEGIFIADSDSDSAIYEIGENYLHPEKRPNTYSLFHVTKERIEGSLTYVLDDYPNRGKAQICMLRSLKPAPGEH